MRHKVKQIERVMMYLDRYGSITTREAFNDLGIARLASRIHDLKKIGYPIKSETIRVKNRFGEDTHYTKYSLEETA